MIVYLAIASSLLLSVPAAAAQPSVAEHFGNIEFNDGAGFIKTLTTDGHSGKPVLSPDGRTVAWIHIDKPQATEPDEAGGTSVWIADGKTGAVRRFAGKADDSPDLRANIVNPETLAFSLDGGFLYVTSELGATSPGVHQIAVGSGMERFVVVGALNGVVRTGPYRGYLIVGQHRYHPQGGSYDASYLYRPDGKEIMTVPGSDDDAKPDAVQAWLASKGWRAW